MPKYAVLTIGPLSEEEIRNIQQIGNECSFARESIREFRYMANRYPQFCGINFDDKNVLEKETNFVDDIIRIKQAKEDAKKLEEKSGVLFYGNRRENLLT